MPESLLPRLKQEIEARLAELRPFVEEAEQLEAAKAALLAAAAPTRGGGASTGSRGGRRGAGTRRGQGAGARGGRRAPRGANRAAILQLVEERPGVSVAEIAAVTRIAKPTVATTVSKLKREGVLADEAGGVKLASRQPVTLAAVSGGLGERDGDGDGAQPAERGAGGADAGTPDAGMPGGGPAFGGEA